MQVLKIKINEGDKQIDAHVYTRKKPEHRVFCTEAQEFAAWGGESTEAISFFKCFIILQQKNLASLNNITHAWQSIKSKNLKALYRFEDLA